MDVQVIVDFKNKIINNLKQVIIGKDHVLDLVVMALISNGHILIEDVPGTGKTILARSLAKSMGGKFSRIQFTPDMLPSDVTGVSVYNQSTKEFEFRPGPILANIVLADEINRATPKTQSALLEAMEEKQVTVDGTAHMLPEIFLVAATQNPIEYEGTFPLPEAQLDRFFVRIRIGYPNSQSEKNIIRSQQFSHPIMKISKVADVDELIEAQREIHHIHVSDKIEQYIVDIIQKTRFHEDIYLGASPRGSLALFRLGQCAAAFDGRDFVIPEDIRKIAPPALSHRIILQASAKMQELDTEEMIEDILKAVPVPGG